MNVPGLSDPAISTWRIRREGGGVGVFLGDNVKKAGELHRQDPGHRRKFFTVRSKKKLITKEQADARLLSF